MMIDNIRNILIALLCICCTLAADAVEMKVKSFAVLMEVMSVPMQRTDNNGEVCALVKVIIPTAQAAFEGNVIGTCDYKTSEYWCFLSPGSKRLKIKYPGCEPLLVDFTELFGSGVQSKKIYELSIIVPAIVPDAAAVTDSILSKRRIEEYMTAIAAVKPDFIHPKRGGLYPFRKGNLWGFFDDSFNAVIPPMYERISNDILITSQYEMFRWIVSRDDFAWDQDFYWVMKKGLWGCIDGKGNTLIPFKYKNLFEPREDYNRCRLCFVTDTLGGNYIIDRQTGQNYHTVGEWEYHRNILFSKSYRTQSLFHVPLMGKKRDVFVDKITGQMVPIKIKNGYEFRSFLPFRHLYFYNPKNHLELILNDNGKVIFDKYVDYPRGVRETQDFEYLFSLQGIYSLEDEKFIYDKSSEDAVMVNDSIVDIRYGVHHDYYDLKNRKVLEELPENYNIVETKYWQYLWDVWRWEKDNSHDISDINYIGDGLFLCNTASGKMLLLIDKYGNYGKLTASGLEFGTFTKAFERDRLAEVIKGRF